MKILMISPEFPPELSGMGDYTYHLACHLQKLDYPVTVLANQSTAGEKELIHGVRILRIIPAWDQSAWGKIRDLIQSGSFPIVHIQYLNLTFNNRWFIHFLPVLIRFRFPHVKTVVTFHEFAAPWKRLMLLPLLFFSNAAIVTNEHHFKSLKDLCKKLFLSKPIQRIPLAGNILPLESGFKKRAEVRDQLGVSPDETLLVRFGILHDISAPGILTLLDAFQLLGEANFPVRLLLIGKEEPKAKELVLTRIKKLGLEACILIKTNAEPDLVSAYLYAADIGLGIYPDGISEKRTAFLSLLAHNLPVIASQRGPLPSELLSGENILAVSVDEPAQAWVQAIRKLIQNPELTQKIKDGARQVSSRHQWQRIAESTAVLYRQTAEAR